MAQTRHYRPQDYEPATWRLLLTGFQDGATNMAIDEAILEAVATGESPPTLRFYGWQPACLSLGMAQPWDDADLERCAGLGWDVVRRPTGGRAILHVDELTYSVCAPESEPRVHGGVLESYQRLSTALAQGLRAMGLDPQRAQAVYEDRGAAGPACFDGPSHYEITIGQRKLVGSAQMRKKSVVLQHGTLPLYGDITRIAEALYVDAPGQRMAIVSRLNYRATTLEASLGRRVEYDEALQHMRQGFSDALNMTLADGQLTDAEMQRAAALRQEKYASRDWTERV
jgi:lipoate-protein ligase A